MKTILVAALIFVVAFILWLPAEPVSGKSAATNLNARPVIASSCGCLQITDLQNRLKAVNAALAALERQQTAERWQVPFSSSSYQDDLVPLIMVALGSARAGAMGRMAGSIDPTSCAIRPDSPPVTGCFADLIAKNVENRRENCESWKSDPNKTGSDYRAPQSMSDVIGELLTSYYEEQGLIEEKLLTLRAQCGNRGGSGSMPPGMPPIVPPTTPPQGPTPPTVTPPSTRTRPPGPPTPSPSPTGTIPPGGVPIGVPPGPPTGGPPVVPPPIPQSSPAVPPPSQPPGSGGPIGVRRRSGYVRYILDASMTFPGLGTFKLTSDSNIPFTITQNRVTGAGTITTIFDTSGSNCRVMNYDATVDVDVTGTRVGNTLNVLVTRRVSGSGPSFADKVANIRMECFMGGDQAFAQMIPNPMSNVTPGVRQRLQLPRPGQAYSQVQTPIGYGMSGPAGPMGLTGTITLRVYSP